MPFIRVVYALERPGCPSLEFFRTINNNQLAILQFSTWLKVQKLFPNRPCRLFLFTQDRGYGSERLHGEIEIHNYRGVGHVLWYKFLHGRRQGNSNDERDEGQVRQVRWLKS